MMGMLARMVGTCKPGELAAGPLLPGIYAVRMVLYYVYDPMCSWCWAFRPAWKNLCEILRTQVPDLRIVNLLGGLAPDSDEPMSSSLRAKIQQHWRTIQRVVPDTPFNFDFWTRCTPRRSTFPACRAVIAAGMQPDAGAHALEMEERMFLAIQQAYYLQARNPSDEALLVQLADEIGLDKERFIIDLNAEDVHKRLMREIELSRRIGVRGFPSLILEQGDRHHPIAIDYRNEASMWMQLLSLTADKS